MLSTTVVSAVQKRVVGKLAIAPELYHHLQAFRDELRSSCLDQDLCSQIDDIA